MAGNDGAGIIYCLGMRVTRCNPDGSPMVGPNNAYCTSAVTQVQHTDQYQQAQEVVQPDGKGGIVYAWKPPDSLKRSAMQLTIVTADPELDELLGSGTLITSGGNSVGLAAPKVGPRVDGGLIIEAWSLAIVGASQAPSLPYARWMFGRVWLNRDARNQQAGPLAPQFSGDIEENALLGNGPFNDWPYTSDRCWQYVREAVLPTFQTGYIAVPAQT